MREGYEALAPLGEFKGGVYRRHSGAGPKNRDAFEAVWEHVSGRELTYPPPRYDMPILMNPQNFAWVPDRDAAGVSRKLLGSFTERGTRIELRRLAADAASSFGEPRARILVFALSGAGQSGGEAWETHSAWQIEPGETAHIAASAPAELLAIVLPMLGRA